jgi:hypothetical protein
MVRLIALGQVTKAHPVQAGTVALLLLSVSNLSLIVLAAFYRVDEVQLSSPETRPKHRIAFGYLSIALAAGSQLLYLGFGAAWFFRWTNFYPGNPIETFAIRLGLLLSIGAVVTAPFGIGLKRCAGLFVGFTTTGVWLLSAIASVSI